MPEYRSKRPKVTPTIDTHKRYIPKHRNVAAHRKMRFQTLPGYSNHRFYANHHRVTFFVWGVYFSWLYQRGLRPPNTNECIRNNSHRTAPPLPGMIGIVLSPSKIWRYVLPVCTVQCDSHHKRKYKEVPRWVRGITKPCTVLDVHFRVVTMIALKEREKYCCRSNGMDCGELPL